MDQDIRNQDAVICTIALNEDLYLDEWITYHIALGFAHIYLYDNTPNTFSPFVIHMMNKYPKQVSIFHAPGHAMQYPAYNHFLANEASKKHKWVAFIDIDEFIVLHKHNNITDFLKDHCPTGAVCINWYIFGTSNQQAYSTQPLVKRMRYREENVNQHVKCILCIQDVALIYNAHFAILKNEAATRDTNGKDIRGPFNPDGPTDVAQINHYYYKSKQEHIDRRGGNDSFSGDGCKRIVDSDETLEKFNQTYDESAFVHFLKYQKSKNSLL
jgi:hypothetical protein